MEPLRTGGVLGPQREKEVKCRVCKRRMEMRGVGFRALKQEGGQDQGQKKGEGPCQRCRELRMGMLGSFQDGG